MIRTFRSIPYGPGVRARGRRFALACARAIAGLAVLGCAGDVAVAPPPAADVSQMYWALTLDHHAVTLSTVAPYDTIRLTATPRAYEAHRSRGSPRPPSPRSISTERS